MIIYSCAPHCEFMVMPGDQVMYGAHEHHVKGLGTVTCSEQGELWVNHLTLKQIVHTHAWVRKA
jgi:hypothetical protein